MPTDLETKKTSKSAAYLQSKFADLCARIRRVDLVAHLLALCLIGLVYSFLIGLFDWFAAATTSTAVDATRWAGFIGFCLAFGIGCVQLVRCFFRSVSPYYVAHEIERTLPDAKNSLINWLDLQDEDIPSAFAKTLSVRAEEHMQEADAEQTVRKRKNWVLLGVCGAPALGLLVLLILSPSAFGSSLLRAFLPFYTPPVLARTQITLVEPAGGDAEVGPAQPIAFAVRIEGRVPVGNRPDAPALHYRYQPNEDFRTLHLQNDGAGMWSAQLNAGQIRTRITYKISAGDAETPEHQVRVRGPAHVKRFEIAYEYRPYRGLKKSTSVFPNERSAKPIVHGPPGTEVEMIVRASRPVRQAAIEVVTQTGKRELPTRRIDGDSQSFVCKWTLEQPGRFRVLFTTTDGEDNTDREWYPIAVTPDEAPRVVLEQPGKDVSVPENGTLELAGSAVSDAGVKTLTLHLRMATGVNEPKLMPIPYQPGMSLRFDDGTYPREIAYFEILALDQLKDDKGRIYHPATESVLEYWLEAADCTDAPNAEGNIGKSSVYKITLTARLDPKKQQAQRDAAQKKRREHVKQQNNNHAQKNTERKNGGGKSDPQKDFDAANKEQDVAKILDEAKKNKEQQQKTGSAKSADQQNGAKKDGPQPGGDGPQAGQKNQPPMSPGDAGQNKDPGDKKSEPGQSKGSGAKEKPAPKKGGAAGESKDGSKDSGSSSKDSGPTGQPPSGGAKDAGAMGMNAPMPTQAKDDASAADAPMAAAKQDPKNDQRPDGPPQGNAKGVEQNGPDVPNKDQQGGAKPTPPNASAKAGAKKDAAGAAKQEPQDQANAGKARGDEPKTGKEEPGLADLGKLIEQMSKLDEKSDEAGEKLSKIAKNSADPRMRDLAEDALKEFGRDPKTGKSDKKGRNLFGSLGKSQGIGDDAKAAAVNRMFAAKIGQMQLADLQKQMTPELLKKAGLGEADWQRYVNSMRSYDAVVRRLNNKLIADAKLKELRGSGALSNTGPQIVGSGTNNSTLDAGSALPPPELLDPQQRFSAKSQTPKAEK